jgi:hypothetical protein
MLRKQFVNDFIEDSNILKERGCAAIRCSLLIDGTLLALSNDTTKVHKELEKKFITYVGEYDGTDDTLVIGGYYSVYDRVLDFPKEYFNGELVENENPRYDPLRCGTVTCPSVLKRTTQLPEDCGIKLELQETSTYGINRVGYWFKCPKCDYQTWRYNWNENPITDEVYNILTKDYLINKIYDATGEIVK